MAEVTVEVVVIITLVVWNCAQEEYSPMKTSPRRRSPRKGNKAEASTESVSMAMNPSSAGVVSMMSSEDKEASVQSPTGSALANEGSLP